MNATARVSSQMNPELKQQTNAILQQTKEQMAEVVTSTWKAAQSCGSQFIDLGLGITTIDRLSQELNAPPHGVTTNALFAGAYLFDLTRIWSLLSQGARHFKQLVLDPSITNLGKAADSTGKVVHTSTRIAYLGCALNALNFSPLLHRANIIATGACGSFSLVANLGDYLHNLSIKNLAAQTGDNELKENALKAMVSDLLRIAESIATIAFTCFSATVSTWSMIPLTTASAALMATAAAFSILAVLNDRLSGPAENYSQKTENLIAQRKKEAARQAEKQNETLFFRFGKEIAKAIGKEQPTRPVSPTTGNTDQDEAQVIVLPPTPRSPPKDDTQAPPQKEAEPYSWWNPAGYV